MRDFRKKTKIKTQSVSIIANSNPHLHIAVAWWSRNKEIGIDFTPIIAWKITRSLRKGYITSTPIIPNACISDSCEYAVIDRSTGLWSASWDDVTGNNEEHMIEELKENLKLNDECIIDDINEFISSATPETKGLVINDEVIGFTADALHEAGGGDRDFWEIIGACKRTGKFTQELKDGFEFWISRSE